MSQPLSSSESESRAWIDHVARKVASLRFGSVQIYIHEGRVTQVESVEKTRWPVEQAAASSRK